MKQQLAIAERAEIERCQPIADGDQAVYDSATVGVAIARHGDLLIIKDKIPKMAKLVETREILRSTITGNVHAVIGEAALYESDGMQYVRVRGVGGLGLHAQHSPGLLPIGEYRVERKREETESGIQRVMD